MELREREADGGEAKWGTRVWCPTFFARSVGCEKDLEDALRVWLGAVGKEEKAESLHGVPRVPRSGSVEKMTDGEGYQAGHDFLERWWFGRGDGLFGPPPHPY